jgi:nickel superoxide dismutase
MSLIERFVKPAYAHCDLFCGVYDPAQARIEAESVLKSVKKYHDSDDEVFKARALAIKEERAQLVKEHLWVLWTDYFQPPHLEQFPELHDLFWRATKAAGDAKKSMKIEDAEALIALVDEVGNVFSQTKDGYNYDAVVANLKA